MTISQRLLLASLIPALMAAMMAIGIVTSYRSVSSLQEQERAVTEEAADANVLSDLARTYLSTHAERPRRQFKTDLAEIENDFAGMSRAAPRYSVELRALYAESLTIGSLFDKLVATHEASSSLPPALAKEAEDTLSGQLFIRLRNLNARAADLAQTIDMDILQTERTIYLLVALFTGVTAVLLTIGALVLRASITRSLRVLRAGTERIGAGELDYRIGLTVHDELGDLGRSFDRMSERLQGVTVSRDALEDEVEERKRAEEELRESLETTRLLLEAADKLATWTDVDGLLDGLAEIVLRATDHSRDTISTWDAERGELTVAAAAGDGARARGVLPFDSISSGLREVITSARTVVNDYDAVPADLRGASGEYDSHLSLQVPLVYRRTVLGVIGVDDPGERREFTEREIEVIEGIASQAAVAIENARLFEAQQLRRRRIEALHGVMGVAISSLDLHEAAKRILEFLVENQGFELAHVWIARGEILELLAEIGYPDTYRERLSPMLLSAPYDLPKVYRSGESLVVPDVSEGNPAVRETYEQLGVELGAYVALPLFARGRTVGTLTLAWRAPHGMNADDVDFYESIAAEVGVALENARLYESERDIADRLQEALLALPLSVPGVEFAHAYHSATEAARVGGDFYDLFELDNDHVAVVIGDVAGKGLDAAVLTSMVKNTIRAHASEKGKMPGLILRLTNDVVFKGTPTEAFVTVFLGILDRRDGGLVYANAGHTTSGLVRPDGDVSELPVTGPLLGGFAGVTFGEADARLDMNDILFLCTDGVTEARRDHELYGEERLFEFLRSTTERTAEDIVAASIADVMRFAGGRLSDDLAILALQRVGRG